MNAHSRHIAPPTNCFWTFQAWQGLLPTAKPKAVVWWSASQLPNLCDEQAEPQTLQSVWFGLATV